MSQERWSIRLGLRDRGIFDLVFPFFMVSDNRKYVCVSCLDHQLCGREPLLPERGRSNEVDLGPERDALVN